MNGIGKFLYGSAVGACVIAALALPALASPARDNAAPPPGTLIDRGNADSFAGSMTAAMLFAVKHGLRIKVVPARRVEWPEAYQHATEQYAAQVSLNDRQLMRNYVAGLPFPTIDAADPAAATKIAYDWRWGPFIPDELSFTDLASRAYTFVSGDPDAFVPDTAHADFRNELTCDSAIAVRRAHALGSSSSLAVGDPSGLEWEERGDQCGPEQGKFIALLYSGADRMPDSYVYMQATRRWRRLAIPLVPNQSCSYSCSQLLLEYMPPKTSLYSWQLAATRTMLACLDGGAAMEKSGDARRFGMVTCEPRPAYVLDMIPRAGYGDLLKARVYLDGETYVYLGGEIWRDRNPDLSAAIWKRDASAAGAKGLILADDLYVPDERRATFMWLDMGQRQRFEDHVAAELFNPKAQN
jgi:uncharacterized protein DUF1329